jgi:hypothetical protein
MIPTAFFELLEELLPKRKKFKKEATPDFLDFLLLAFFLDREDLRVLGYFLDAFAIIYILNKKKLFYSQNVLDSYKLGTRTNLVLV